jgi:hypothetical protein
MENNNCPATYEGLYPHAFIYDNVAKKKRCMNCGQLRSIGGWVSPGPFTNPQTDPLNKMNSATLKDIVDRVGKDSNPKDAIGDTKLPMHLVSGIVKCYQAIAHFLGNVKYGAWNYRAKGARASVYRAALDRHMDAWWEGEDIDPTDGTPHLANALACINILIEASEAGKLEDDRPPSSNYREVVERLTPLVAKLKAQYKDRNPVHYTIKDTKK